MKLRIIAIASMLFIGLRVWGHELEIGLHGGREVETGTHHIELVVKDSAVDVFVTDANDQPVSIDGLKGVAIFTISGKAHRIVLEPKDGTSRLLKNAVL